MRVVVFGAGGQLGSRLVDEFADHDVTGLASADCDVSDFEQVMSAAVALGPQLLVNAAAMTAVDACETELDRSHAVNAIGPRNLVLAARRCDADLLHVSTDYVFDGDTDDPYDEWAARAPRSMYGRSKLAGEREVAAYGRAYVARTSVVYSATGKNFAIAIARKASATDGEIEVVSDQVANPTYVPHLAAALRVLAVSGRYGTYHVTGTGACSRADLARALLESMGHDPGRIVDIPTEKTLDAYPAPRPRNSALEGRAWRLAGFDPLPHWREGVDDFSALPAVAEYRA